MSVRQPHVAGSFYPGTASKCEEMLVRCLSTEAVLGAGEHRVVGGVVPHAGWIFSGPTAGRVFRAVQESGGADTFILFGAVHVWGVDRPSVYARGAWRTPLGDAPIDEELAAALLDTMSGFLVDAPEAHESEHSLEVQVPFLQHLFPAARILPIMVPPMAEAARLGREVARVVEASRGAKRVVALGSSDLTHYGPNYRFMPKGLGAGSLEWVKTQNDKRILDLAIAMKEDAIVSEAMGQMNACGPGAMAAACAFASQFGASTGRLVGYTTSYDVMPERQPTSFVGYGGVVYEA
ncbi:MAG: AmmeMemoRadiSam system protein B [Candidatus Wallbacteria bacterium]|nr:AmmeMemoRadiSam system protein B [Candidatus Wallbacteria bacterium]